MPLLLAYLASAISLPEAPPCRPMTGYDAVLQRSNLQWIVVGEIHGTAEIPATFLDLVCSTAEARKSLVIGVELPESLQPDIDAFVRSEGSGRSSVDFARKIAAANIIPDGRSSQAIVNMLAGLRPYVASGKVIDVRGIVPKASGNLRKFENDMAINVLHLRDRGASVALVLVGSVHAQSALSASSAGATIPPMASQLPPAQTIALSAMGWGGSAWNCRGNTQPDARTISLPQCGAFAVPAPAKRYGRGIILVDGTNSPYDGYLNIGSTFSASKPAS